MEDWFCIKNISRFDSPMLVIYPDRVQQNIQFAIRMIGDVKRLRPHVKTNKIAEVCALMMNAGITKFKCATIAEAEMLSMIGASDVLLAYQPVEAKMQRFLSLIKAYPQTSFSCLIDNEDTAQQLHDLAEVNDISVPVYIDVNVGMNRTGIHPDHVLSLAEKIISTTSLSLKGLHAYDGHIRDSDINVRTQKSEAAFEVITSIRQRLSKMMNQPLTVVAGGTPTFPVHLQHSDYECSPGTFVFSDWGYKHALPDEPFIYAALVITRVISIIDEETICVDLGHKSIAAENPLPRVHFLNAPDAVPISQSEEHLVLEMPSQHRYRIGDVLYGVPVHICPTVALYDEAYVAEDGNITKSWSVIARKRKINV